MGSQGCLPYPKLGGKNWNICQQGREREKSNTGARILGNRKESIDEIDRVRRRGTDEERIFGRKVK